MWRLKFGRRQIEGTSAEAPQPGFGAGGTRADRVALEQVRWGVGPRDFSCANCDSVFHVEFEKWEQHATHGQHPEKCPACGLTAGWRRLKCSACGDEAPHLVPHSRYGCDLALLPCGRCGCERGERCVCTLHDDHRWEFVSSLDEAGIWATWVIRDAFTGELRAGRVLLDWVVRDRAGLLAAVEELDAAKRIASEYVAPAEVVGFRGDAPFVIMPTLKDGVYFATRIQAHGLMPWDEFRPLIEQFLQALEAIQRAGIRARTVLPSNVYLREDGRILLTDFGFKRVVLPLARRAWAQDFVLGGALRQDASDLVDVAALLALAVTATDPREVSDDPSAYSTRIGDPEARAMYDLLVARRNLTTAADAAAVRELLSRSRG